jgi:hypothetical protein
VKASIGFRAIGPRPTRGVVNFFYIGFTGQRRYRLWYIICMRENSILSESPALQPQRLPQSL